MSDIFIMSTEARSKVLSKLICSDYQGCYTTGFCCLLPSIVKHFSTLNTYPFVEIPCPFCNSMLHHCLLEPCGDHTPENRLPLAGHQRHAGNLSKKEHCGRCLYSIHLRLYSIHRGADGHPHVHEVARDILPGLICTDYNGWVA